MTVPDLNNIFPLPQRVVPSLGEDLVSVVCRTARQMGYAHPQWILHPESQAYSVSSSSLPLLAEQQSSDIFKRLLLLDEATLYQHTLYAFSSFKYLLDSQSKMLKTYFVNFTYIKVCPLCLQEDDPYDRLHWRLRFVFFCPQHRVVLQEYCPHCHERIPALRPRAFLCPKCKIGDYRQAVSSVLQEDHPLIRGERLFLNACGVDYLGAFNLLEDETPFRSIGIYSKSYLDFFVEMHAELERKFLKKEIALLNVLSSALTKEDVFYLSFLGLPGIEACAFVHILFFHWPKNFFALLDVLYRVALPPCSARMEEFIFRFCRNLFATEHIQQTFPWLHQAFVEHGKQFKEDPHFTQKLCQRVNELANDYDWYHDKYQSEAIPRQQRYYTLFRPLPVSVTPYDWESLSSLLSRAARRMGNFSPMEVLHSAFTANHSRVICADTPDVNDLQLFSYLLQLEIKEIQPLALERFESVLGIIDDTHFFRRSLDVTALCPLCLSEDKESYDRVYWQIRDIHVCPKHRVLLINKCSNCQKAIPSLRPQALLCPFCQQGRYGDAEKNALSEKSILVTSTCFLLSRLGVSVALEHVMRTFATSPIYTLQPKQYFFLLEEISANILAYYPSAHLLKILKAIYPFFKDDIWPYQEYLSHNNALATLFFHAMFSEWPHNFFVSLDMLSPVPHEFFLGHTTDYVLRTIERLARMFPWLGEIYWEYRRSKYSQGVHKRR